MTSNNFFVNLIAKICERKRVHADHFCQNFNENQVETNRANIFVVCFYVCKTCILNILRSRTSYINSHTLSKITLIIYTYCRVVWVTMIKWCGVTRTRYILQIFFFLFRVSICMDYIKKRSLSKHNSKKMCVWINMHGTSVLLSRILIRVALNPTDSIFLQCVCMCIWHIYRCSWSPEHHISTYTHSQKSFSTYTVFFVVWVTMIK